MRRVDRIRWHGLVVGFIVGLAFGDTLGPWVRYQWGMWSGAPSYFDTRGLYGPRDQTLRIR